MSDSYNPQYPAAASSFTYSSTNPVSQQQDNTQQYSPQQYEDQQQISSQMSYGSVTENNQYQPNAGQYAQGPDRAAFQRYPPQPNSYAPVIDHSRDYYPSAAAHQPPSLAWDPQTMSPFADPDFDPNAPMDPDAPEGERGIRHAIIGGTTGYIVGHKSGHGVTGAAIGAVVGDVLSDIRHNIRHHIRDDWGEPAKQSDSQRHSSDHGHSSHHHSTRQ